MIFAQIPTASGESWAAWLVGAAATIVFVKNVLSVIRHFQSKPPAGELAGGQQELARRISELERDRVHQDERRRALYEHIDKVRGELTDKIEAVHQRVDEAKDQMHEQIKDLPNELIVVLRNTGAIHPK